MAILNPSTDKMGDSVRQHLCLAMVAGVGPLMQRRLLEHFGRPEKVLRASPSELQSVQGVGPKLASAIARASTDIDVDRQLQMARDNRIDILLESNDKYPPLLSEIPDPPAVLFTRGLLQSVDRLAVAIVGARHASQYGLQQASRFATSLAHAGITVVSGMARGIDTAAHRAALAAGGRTIAVLASGVLRPYPPENHSLAEQIAAQGSVVSEAAPTAPPLGGMFPQRNRLISGLTLGTIVVEASQRSGALITARLAWEQNREVFAVPGPVDSRLSTGPHQLIRDGAKLVSSIDDVLEELGPLAHAVQREDGSTVRAPAELALNEVENQVLQAVESQGSLIDEVTQTTGLPVHRVLSTVSVLEMRNLVRRVGGNRIARV
ncbi:MAG: DNA-processing protein DprA [Pirellulales bacterium]|nr:DNA-processing protein DprA [Pirellulales bacterium]